MKSPLAPRIREELRDSDGLTCAEIAVLVGKKYETVRKALMTMPDAYIDRWVANEGKGVHFISMWVLADVPENCPHPTKGR